MEKKASLIIGLAQDAAVSADVSLTKSASSSPQEQEVVGALLDCSGLSKKASLASVIGTGAAIIHADAVAAQEAAQA